jgi:hypothetical protein
MMMVAINVIPTQSNVGIAGARLILPGHPEKSVLYHRVAAPEQGRMPPLATALVDSHGLEILEQWIRSGLGMGSSDTDNDGSTDDADNCRLTANLSQLDTDGDRYGNVCDADFNNDERVNMVDLGVLRNAFGTNAFQAEYREAADMTGDGTIDESDVAAFATRFGRVVGDQDTDADSIADGYDNCLAAANIGQQDTDADGFGNACDADFDNSGFVNLADLVQFRAAFGKLNPNADLDGSGGPVNFKDLTMFRSLFGKPPGPASRSH